MNPAAVAADERQTAGTSDLRDLFDEWTGGLKKKILTLAEGKHDPGEIAAALGMPEKDVLKLLFVMVREGSIRITGVETNK